MGNYAWNFLLVNPSSIDPIAVQLIKKSFFPNVELDVMKELFLLMG